MNRYSLRFEAAGVAVIYCAAVFLHFVYRLSDSSALGMVFGAVNESVWEHVKIFSFAYMGWAMIEAMFLKLPFRQYAVSKCIGLYTLIGSMIGFYYLYTSFTGKSILRVDVISSLVLVAAAQALSFFLETRAERLRELFYPALLLFFLYYLMFFSFTVFPPRIKLFCDPLSGTYGINSGFAA